MQNSAQTNATPTLSAKAAYFSVKDAANYLGVGIGVIYQIIKDPDGPPHLRIKTRKKAKPLIRIPKKQFLAWVAQNES